ncbi:peptide chain release factor 1 [Phanerochaete sordida]|uniref:Peptide chain release factor 1 n=1 Tax=Phanerochaete sordida TaxID=48140 RepID=A0A9P3G2P4_9APHY|nr:peptide chain release factor 1 [Phanerochaete sordida]
MLRTALRLRVCLPPPRARTFRWSATPHAQPRADTKDNVAVALEKSPVVQAVQRRLQQRSEMQAKVQPDSNTAEDKQTLQRIHEMEPLRAAWEEWENTRNLLAETTRLLQDPDPTMQALAQEERSELLARLAGLAERTFPALLVPPSATAHLAAMLELKAGVGGSESSLFAAEVLRMYVRLAQAMGWHANIVANNETDNGGVKDAVLEIKGERAYDLLRWESGVHRVQRVPATEFNGRVHTSTVAVLVLPLAEDKGSEVDEELFKMEEVKVEVMRSRGAGGQHVNKTESAVRLTHLPTGITVSMQDERSQHQNRRRAFQVLRARLMDRKLIEDVKNRRDVRRNLVSSADRSEKIRTYNFPQDRVTDHRIGLSLMNVEAVMEGEGLRDFLDELAKKHQDDLLEEAFVAS